MVTFVADLEISSNKKSEKSSQKILLRKKVLLHLPAQKGDR